MSKKQQDRIQARDSYDQSSSRKSGYQQLPYTESHHDGKDSPKPSRKKWYIGGGILLVLIVAAVVVVLTVGGHGTDNGGGGNKPGPPTPPGPPIIPNKGYNPYSMEPEFNEDLVDEFKGVLKRNPNVTNHQVEADHVAVAEKLFGKEEVGASRIGVESKEVINAIGQNNKYVDNVAFAFGQASYKRTVLKLSDADSSQRFSIPEDVVPRQNATYQYRLEMADFHYVQSPFSFSFASTRTNKTLIDTKDQTFIFQDKFIQVDMLLPTGHVYGFGERQAPFELGVGAWSMWSQDVTAQTDTGRGGKQLAGMHPFCLIKADDEEFFGIFFRSANAQAPIVTYVQEQNILSYITTGGNLDINFFLRGSAKEIIKQYQNYIGLAELPPFWALGWHASSNAWTTLSNVTDVVGQYEQAEVPLEAVWLDGSYMIDHKNFNVDNKGQGKWLGVDRWTQDMHNWGKNVILQIYAGLDKDSGHLTDSSPLLKDGADDFKAQTVTGTQTVFLDWFNPDAKDTWATGLFHLMETIQFDGLWLSENAPSIMCEGGHPECDDDIPPAARADKRRQLRENVKDSDDDIITDWYTSYGAADEANSSTYHLPFIPQTFNLDVGTISLNVTHGLQNADNTTMKEYDVHGLFGHMQSKVTYEILNDQKSNSGNNRYAGLRKFISSTSTFAGTGKYAQHHLQPQLRTWEALRYSISGIMNFNMFGIPFTGADVCAAHSSGMDQDPAEQQEICKRWYQLAAFYPWARTNRDDVDGGIPIEPYELSDDNVEVAVYSIKEKYKFARYMYECLFVASQEGGTCFDPLFYEYPGLDGAYTDIESTFLVGNSVKVSPILKAMGNETIYQSFFPKGKWADLDDYSIIEVVDDAGKMIDLKATTTIKKHLRPGHIIPVQQGNDDVSINSTVQLLQLPVDLIINRDDKKQAVGRLFLDDGVSKSEITDKKYEYYEFQMVNHTIQKNNLNPADGIDSGTQEIGSIIITNADEFSGDAVSGACLISRVTRQITQLSVPEYDEDANTLTIKAKDTATINVFEMEMIHFTTSDDTYSLCDYNYGQWKVDKDTFNPDNDLDTSSANFELYSESPALKGMRLAVSLNLGDTPLGVTDYSWKKPMLNVKVYQPGVPKFTVPKDIVDIDSAIGNCKAAEIKYCQLKYWVNVNMDDKPDYILSVTNDAGAVHPQLVWTLDNIIQENLLNIIKSRPTTKIDADFQGMIGLFERTTDNIFIESGVYSLWSRDAASPETTGNLPASNTYGVHPFYMIQSPDDSWLGVYTNLAHAQDWVVNNDNVNGQVNITTIATGGIADVTLIFGSDPHNVTKRYHDLVGKPVLTPMWALGWQQCKWGYTGTEEIKENVDQYQKNYLPLDVQWSDIDYMDDYKDFTISPRDEWKTLADLVNTTIHANDIKFIPIVDAGIAQRDGGNYSVYNSGKDRGVFINAYKGTDTLLTGQVWPNDAVFPDFFRDATKEWWGEMLSDFYEQLPFDGLWQDMNEASNFCNGYCYENQMENTAVELVKNKLVYTPSGRDLETKSLPLDAFHTTIKDEFGADVDVTELDAHSLFATMQVQASHEWFNGQNKRTMITSRSSFAGMGKFGSRWLGDNFSSYSNMGHSVTGIMMNGIAGIPLAGADICGFLDNTDMHMCTQWYQIGAWYPFSRNHYTLGATPQEPWRFADDYISPDSPNKALLFIRRAMLKKQVLLNYYYTEISMLHEEGGVFYQAPFFEFPMDTDASLNLTNNVMLGKYIKISHQTQNASHVNFTTDFFYFPEGVWCNVFNLSTDAGNGDNDNSNCITGPVKKELESFFWAASWVHLRWGGIVPMQYDALNPSGSNKNMKQMQQNPIDLHIHPEFKEKDEDKHTGKCTAKGRFLNDDGEVLDYTGYQNRYQFNFNSNCTNDNTTKAFNMVLKITQDQQATKVPNPKGFMNVTNNDFLGKVEFYNTQSTYYRMDGNYKVTVKWLDDEAAPLDLSMKAEFDSVSQHTVLQNIKLPDGNMLGLWNITQLEFTLEADEAANPVLEFNENEDLLTSG